MMDLARMVTAQWSATLILGVVTIALQLVLARALGPAEFGLYSVATAVGAIALVVQTGGYRALLLREGVRATPGMPERRNIFAKGLGHLYRSTFLMVAAAVLIGTVLGSPLTLPLALVLGINAPRVIALLLSAHALARGAMADEARWQVRSRVLPSIAAAVLAVASGSLTLVLLAMLAAQALVLRWPPDGTPRLTMDLEQHQDTLKASLGIFAIELLTQLYTRQSMMVLYAASVPIDEIGRLGALLRLLEAYTLLLGPLVVIFHNRVRSGGVRSAPAQQLAMLVVAGSTAAIAVGFVVAMAAGAGVLHLLLGSAYRSAAHLLPWLLAVGLVMVPNMLMSQVLIARNREWSYTAIAAAMVPFNLLLNVCLVGWLGTKGAVIAMLATEAVLGGLMAWRIARD